MKIIFVSQDPKPERWTSLLSALIPNAKIEAWSIDTAMGDADYAVVWQPPDALFTLEPNLRALFNLGAGVDALLKSPALPDTLPIYRLEDAGMSSQMAEYAVHFVTEFSRDMGTYRQQSTNQVWKTLPPIRKEQWPIGILGYGKIGSAVAQVLSSLEYPVATWVRQARESDVNTIEMFCGSENLNPFLNRSRILINTLPLTDSTENLLNYTRLAQLKEHAILMNVGRGEHLVDEDLLLALQEGRIQHAILDVFRQEPLPAQHPFWGHEKITITPHVSARTLRDSTVAQIAEKIIKLEAGQDISGCVDRRRGY
ncbi:2-hydroxyacid dehydrogenase [Nitrincola nitratireducens]|uniref:Glyoxylate/hydroxypyruvate reductase A n=1 Tax=Nitrincola nitratireducens TaxID=1229521 RepID=W9V8C0_9GAMM|nr:glyoxylate/hydroxypyruvate reductase A [Nitrincola nitratireducens]EXJ13136.1 Glyoxylate/hydroxypyruvate reductase A [Nitrincola nitratireducens]